MNFYDSLTNNWSFGRFYGLNYFTTHQNHLKITTKTFLRSLIPGFSLVLITLIGGYCIRPDEADFQSFGIGSIMFVVGQIEVIVQFTNSIIIEVMAFTHRKELIQFFEMIYELDDILEKKLQIHLNYRKMKTRSSRRLYIIQSFYVIISCIISYANASNESYILILVIYSYAGGINIMNSFEYINGTIIIKSRFKSLNDLLIRSEHINPNHLEIMIKCHLTLNELITHMNEIYGSRMLLSIANDFVIVIVQIYSFFVAIENGFNDVLYVKFLYGSLLQPLLMAKLYFVSTNCQKVLSHKNKFGKLLKKFESLKTILEFSHMVYIFK